MRFGDLVVGGLFAFEETCRLCSKTVNSLHSVYQHRGFCFLHVALNIVACGAEDCCQMQPRLSFCLHGSEAEELSRLVDKL